MAPEVSFNFHVDEHGDGHLDVFFFSSPDAGLKMWRSQITDDHFSYKKRNDMG